MRFSHILLLATLFVICPNCASTQKPGPSKQLDLSRTGEQIDNVNYLIHLDWEKLRAAKSTGGKRDEIKELEFRLYKLSKLRDYLEEQRSRLKR